VIDKLAVEPAHPLSAINVSAHSSFTTQIVTGAAFAPTTRA